MANPFKQISARRLLPFPGSSRRCAASGVEQDHDGYCMDTLKACLTSHPEVLEEIILDTVEASQLTQWIQKKKSRVASQDSMHSSLKQPLLQEKYTTLDISAIQKDLLQGLQSRADLLPQLYELANVIGTAIRSDNVALYVTRSGDTDLYLYVPGHEDNNYQLGLSGRVACNTTVAAHVAKARKSELVKDIHVDVRFPNGIGVEGSLTQSVLCVPFTQPTDDLLCVLQFGRNWQNPVFDDRELQLVTAMVGWSGLAIHMNDVSNTLQKQRELNDFLLDISRIMFDDVVAMDTLVEKIMTFAKDLVTADRCALFLVDREQQELYSNLFDEGLVENGVPVFTRKDMIRFPIGKGIAGTVAKTGEIVNIKDAYSDSRFNRQIDRETGYTTHNILCMPIISKCTVIGVVQMINKLSDNGENSMGFTTTDESAFKMFAVYCALALHYSKVYSELQQLSAEYSVTQDMLRYHSQVSEQEVDALVQAGKVKDIPPDLDSFYFYGPSSHLDQLPNLFMNMLENLLGSVSFDKTRLCRFLLTVKKYYRPVSYHNWQHGWNVAHSTYCFLLLFKDTGLISPLRMQALMVGSLCHDIDHRGLNNSFYVKFKEPMASLYPSSVMENHHFACAIKLLEREELNIFSDLSPNDYKLMVKYMRHAIIATDLALHFPVQKAISKLIVSRSFDRKNASHMDDLISLMMTASDLSAVVKPWQDQQDAVQYIYDEFYHQGDLEKQRGEQLIPMLDRNNKHNMPKDQVNFIKLVCLPCYQTLADLIPEAGQLLSGCRDNLEQWERVVEGKSTKVWEPAKSRVDCPSTPCIL